MATQEQNLAAAYARVEAAHMYETQAQELAEEREWFDGETPFFTRQRIETLSRGYFQLSLQCREDARRLFVLSGMSTADAEAAANA